jgi:outer membrane protein OmpA-like peptidoglycan-associated protein
MKRSGRYAVLAIVLGLSACLDSCSGDKKKDEGTAAASGGANVAAGSLILAAQQQGAFLPPELSDPRYADESTLPMGSFQLPAADFSKAGTEIEPNNTEATATPLTPLGQGFAIRGENSPGDYDFYVFETAGEPQLWAIEAVGKSVSELSSWTSGSNKAQAQQVDSGTLVIPNLYLAAGKHFIEVGWTRSASGPYTLRAVPLGKPDLRMEREPNDDESFANPLRAGISRVGFLLDGKDRDNYSFALREPGRVLLQVTSPPGIKLNVRVYRTGGKPSYTFTARAKGESMRMDVMLPPGDYLAVLGSYDVGSRTPYKIRLDLLDPFSSPPDREPNNDYAEAAPLPPDLVLRGSVGEYGDEDWYLLPTLSRETSMRVQVLGMSTGKNPRSSIQVINRSSGRNEYLTWAGTDSILEMRLPVNAPLFIQLSGKGDYQLRLSFNPGIPPIAGKAPFTVSLPPGPYLVEAFSTLAQRQPLPVTINNPGTQRIQVALDAVVSHSAWSVTPARQMVTVDPGKQIQVPLQLNLPPDAGAGEAVQIAVRASSPGGSASATTKVYALCGATPANPETYSPLPSQMLGGLNLAAASLGAHPVTPDANKLGREKLLYDGMTPNDQAWANGRPASEPALMLTVALAGDRPAIITGITLIPGNGNLDDQVDQFDVLVSEDGQTYRQVMSGRLRATPAEQAFAFAQPVRARFAQLRLRSNQPGGRDNWFTLGEWKVIGAPGESPFTTTGFNLADPALGGHVVWSQPLFSAPDAVLSEKVDGYSMRLDPVNPNEWVVGFRHNRAAQISRLEWVQPAAVAVAGGIRMLSTVEVSVSTESPIGPWTPVGSWKIAAAAGSTTPLNLTEPVWARFVRFSTREPRKAQENWRLAETIRIYERGTDVTYRSVLAEWGHYARPAIYERMVAAPAAPNAEEVTGNGKRDDAKKIESGKAYRGRVIVDEKEDWYRIEMPRDHNRLSVNLQGDPMLKAVASLQDESGKTIPAKTGPGPGGITRMEAIVEGGKTYFLRLVEPPRSIALVFDNSSSVRPYSPTLFRALGRFVEAVQPRREFVNLLPFQDRPPKFLLSSWSDQPYVLQGAVQNYSRVDGSSNAELALLAATQELENRQGSKAILLLTDAASDGYGKTAELWAALSRVPARVFAVELHSGNDAERQQHLMRDWADANDGHYSTFRVSEDIDMAFERTSCYLRRPARYTMTAETRFEEPTGAIEKLLAKSGRVDVYGIYFDVGSATIKPESEPVLKEISDALAKNPAWKLSVEGHTDNVGGDASNMGLSRRRAASVKVALVTRYGIAGDRLVTAGFGASRPKESNGTVKGRARNRRVELVRQ